MAEAPAPQRAKSAIPRNPGRHELGMKASLLFPDKAIVERFYVPMHSVVRIDEVHRGGPARIVARDDKKQGTVAHFPVPMYPPPGGSGGGK